MRQGRYLLVAVVCLTLGVWLLSCVTAGAQEPESRLFKGLGVAYLVLSGMDAAQTTWAMGHGGFSELNPVMRPLTKYPGALGGVKIALPVFINYGTSKGYRTNPKTALWLRVALVGVQTSVVVWNANQLRRAR